METSVEDNFVARRRTQPAEKLSAETIQWLDDLPAGGEATLLQIEFVRIANALSRRWKAPAAFLAHLDDLLIDEAREPTRISDGDHARTGRAEELLSNERASIAADRVG